MPHSFRISLASNAVGRTPWSAREPLVPLSRQRIRCLPSRRGRRGGRPRTWVRTWRSPFMRIHGGGNYAALCFSLSRRAPLAPGLRPFVAAATGFGPPRNKPVDTVGGVSSASCPKARRGEAGSRQSSAASRSSGVDAPVNASWRSAPPSTLSPPDRSPAAYPKTRAADRAAARWRRPTAPFQARRAPPRKRHSHPPRRRRAPEAR